MNEAELEEQRRKVEELKKKILAQKRKSSEASVDAEKRAEEARKAEEEAKRREEEEAKKKAEEQKKAEEEERKQAEEEEKKRAEEEERRREEEERQKAQEEAIRKAEILTRTREAPEHLCFPENTQTQGKSLLERSAHLWITRLGETSGGYACFQAAREPGAGRRLPYSSWKVCVGCRASYTTCMCIRIVTLQPLTPSIAPV